MYPYRNKDLLNWEYWVCQKDMKEIADKYNTDFRRISYWMKRGNIPARIGKKPPNHVELTKKALEFIEGELLGDGCIMQASKQSANFHYSSKYLEYINFMSSKLDNYGIGQSGKIYEKDRRNEHKGLYYNYHSRNYAELLPIREEWYPNNKKIIPKDLELTSLVCKQWYIGDGSLGKNRYRLTFHTEGFIREDILFLISKLKEIGFKANINKSNYNQYKIRLANPKKQIPKFLDYIGQCPVQCYQYKWEV